MTKKKIGEYHHTLTAWENKEMMMNYIRSKFHLKAMKNFQSIGTGSTFGFEGNEIPNWKKQHLPSKICPTCKRPFVWRKKWRLNWEKVKYCSKKCSSK